MSDVEDVAGHMADEPPPTPVIRPIETVLAVVFTVLLIGNVVGDWQSADYGGGMVSVALIVLIGAILGKNMGSLIGGSK